MYHTMVRLVHQGLFIKRLSRVQGLFIKRLSRVQGLFIKRLSRVQGLFIKRLSHVQETFRYRDLLTVMIRWICANVHFATLSYTLIIYDVICCIQLLPFE